MVEDRKAPKVMMQAAEMMTTQVQSAAPETPLRELARLLLDHGISAVPVVESTGAVVGMVSEGDLIGRDDAQREQRRDWWLALLADGEELHPGFLASLRNRECTARDVMSSPVVTVAETTPATEIARLLAAYHIKRVPVVRDGKVVGIVSRADLLRAFASESTAASAPKHHSPAYGMIGEALSKLDEQFLHGRRERPAAGAAASAASPDLEPTADDFNKLIADFGHRQIDRRAEASRVMAKQRQQAVEALIDQHLSAESWNSMLHSAREAAEHGVKEFMLLRFPSDLCTDGGRAVNAPLPDWPKTLRGDAAEIYLRWERDLKPRGFHLTARMLDFPGGKPGDVGLFLVWGG
jgi:CBS domain-containing protein